MIGKVALLVLYTILKSISKIIRFKYNPKLMTRLFQSPKSNTIGICENDLMKLLE
jgi:hypothetical protein